MTTDKQIEIARALIATGLLSSVYHSVELVEDETGVKFPAHKKGSEQFYVGPDDSKSMFAYIRQNGPVTRIEEKDIGGCTRMYKMSAPHRIVIFQDHVSGDFGSLTRQLLNVVFIKDVSLISYNSNAFQLAKQESPIADFAFDATTFYLAIDIQIRFMLAASICEVDNCIVYPNPVCKDEL